jgi:hypothetical protein
VPEQWRLDMGEAWRGVRFERKVYRRWNDSWDHDHCLLCGRTLAEAEEGYADAQHEGYATTEDYVHGAEYSWLCVDCFEDAHEALEWGPASPAAEPG